MLPKGYKTVVDWLKVVAKDEKYENPELTRVEEESDDEADKEDGFVPEKPSWEIGGEIETKTS